MYVSLKEYFVYERDGIPDETDSIANEILMDYVWNICDVLRSDIEHSWLRKTTTARLITRVFHLHILYWAIRDIHLCTGIIETKLPPAMDQPIYWHLLQIYPGTLLLTW